MVCFTNECTIIEDRVGPVSVNKCKSYSLKFVGHYRPNPRNPQCECVFTEAFTNSFDAHAFCDVKGQFIWQKGIPFTFAGEPVDRIQVKIHAMSSIEGAAIARYS